MDDDSFFMGDTEKKPVEASDSDSTDSDWDQDSEEEQMKKDAKAAEKARKAEELRLKLAREEATRLKNHERMEAERKKKEARIAELNRLKSPEERKIEDDKREQNEADDFLGCCTPVSDEQEDPMVKSTQSLSISTEPKIDLPKLDGKPTLHNFAPKVKGKMSRNEATTLAGHLTDKLFEYQDDPNFIVVVDQVFRLMCNKHEDEDWEKIKQFGKTVSAIGNEKQTSHKKKTERKKKGGKKPRQGISRADDFAADGEDDVYADFM